MAMFWVKTRQSFSYITLTINHRLILPPAYICTRILVSSGHKYFMARKLKFCAQFYDMDESEDERSSWFKWFFLTVQLPIAVVF